MTSQPDELQQLIAEQAADMQSYTIKPEYREQVPFTDSIANLVGVQPDGEIVSYEPRPKRGTLLVGTATWHGSRSGYVNHKCRCKPCTDANSEYFSKRRNGSSE